MSAQPSTRPAARRPFYTLIAYWPDGVDTCRGCVMARTSSDFSLQTFRDQDALVQAWGQALSDSAGLGREFCPVELSLLVDGMDEDHGWAAFESGEMADEPPHRALESRAIARSLELSEAAKRQKDAEQAAARRRAEEAAQAREQADYLRLHAKFAGR